MVLHGLIPERWIAEITGGQITTNWGWDFLENDISDCVSGIRKKVSGGRVYHFEAFMDCLAILHDIGSLTYDNINEFLEDHGIGYRCESGFTGSSCWSTVEDANPPREVEIPEETSVVDYVVIRESIIEPREVESAANMNENKTKPHKLFISHSSKDKPYMEALAEMLEDIGMPDGSFVCTSVPGHGIPGGAKIFDWLRNQFLTCDLRVMFALSHNYYESAASLNEMGAAWITKATDTLLLLPGFTFSEVDGCVDPREMGISFGMEEAELKHRLNELKDTLIAEHNLSPITQARWERHRDKFIRKVREIAEQAKDETTDTAEPRSNTDPFDYPPLQLHASVMLFFAAEDRGEIIVSSTLSGTSYCAGKACLNESNEPRELAKWESAVEQLINGRYIKRTGKKDPIYQVTEKGYSISDAFKSDNQLDANMSPSQIIEMFDEK